MSSPARQRYDPAPFATNKSTKVEEWTLQLENGATLTGIFYAPKSSSLVPNVPKPLVVGIHGATCCAYNYDPSPDYSVSLYCDTFGIPFVAFNRPNFLNSSGWIVDRSSKRPFEPVHKSTEQLSYFEEEARWYHELIFPALWQAFAAPRGCAALVTTSHSMSVPITIIASTLYAIAQDRSELPYRWAGMVLSGFGDTRIQHSLDVSAALTSNQYGEDELPAGQYNSVHLPPYRKHDKQELMLGEAGICEEHLRPLIWQQTTPFLIQEVVSMVDTWPGLQANFMAAVKMPVLYGLGEHDWVWKSDRKNVDEFCQKFVAASRVEGAAVSGAPHAIEWSEVSFGWWTRIFGWAAEVCDGCPNTVSAASE